VSSAFAAVGQVHAAKRPGDDLHEFEDFDASERPGHFQIHPGV
jgi:hypothetical protein